MDGQTDLGHPSPTLPTLPSPSLGHPSLTFPRPVPAKKKRVRD
ncbi:MAG: hypothetical protein WC483_00300 [Candidatus Paceibacterota bacterium]